MISRALVCAIALLGAACGGESPSEQLPPPVFLRTTALPAVAYGDDYSTQLLAQGGTEPFRFSLASGRLPDAITLSSSGRLEGPAIEPGTHSFAIRVDDARNQFATRDFTLRIEPEPLEIANRTLPGGREDMPYQTTLTARGGVRPYVWSISAGALAPGLSLDAEGRIAGTPVIGGVFNFTVEVRDSESKTASQPLVLMFASVVPMITTIDLPKAHTDVLYEARLAAEGGVPPYTWTVAGGELPPGLALATDGVIAGTPVVPGLYDPIFEVTDARARSDRASIRMRVIAPLIITTPVIDQIVRNRPYEFQLQAIGGEPPYTWSIGAGARLPAGISFDGSGRFTGTTNELGEFPLTIRVRDTANTISSAQFTLSVSERYVYRVEPTGMDAIFPPTCTGTTVSYKYVDIVVPESFQIADVDVRLDVSHPAMIGLRIVLFGPGGGQSVLCGDEAGPWGGCQPIDLMREYDDDGQPASRPERPLSVFDGENARATWRLLIATIEPSCTMLGNVRSVTLSITDDRSPAPYLRIWGWEKNNLVTQPFIHIRHPLYPNLGVGPHELQLRAAIYDVGPNGFREAGQGDDVLDPTVASWSWLDALPPGTTLDPDGYVRVDSSGAVCAAGDCPGTGQARIVAAGGGLMVTTMLRVLPPDFDPKIRRY